MSMIIRRELITAVLRGDKTQHRIVAKEGECLFSEFFHVVTPADEIGKRTIRLLCGAEIRHFVATKYKVGNTYAVQEHQSKPALWVSDDGTIAPEDRVFDGGLYSLRNRRDHYVYRIQGYTPLHVQITAIRREHLVDISEADARTEGMQFDPIADLYYVPGDPAICFFTAIEAYSKMWNTQHTRKGQRWGDAVDVWVLGIEVVRAK